MTSHEIAFAGGTFRIDVEVGPDIPRYTARIGMLVDGGQTLRPLVFENGARVEIHATSEPLAVSSAIAYLESRFGAPSELQHGFIEWQRPFKPGRPLLVER
jgi:hypothetical protein